MIPQQDGMASLAQGIGSTIALAQLGYDSGGGIDELGDNLYNHAARQTGVPVLSDALQMQPDGMKGWLAHTSGALLPWFGQTLLEMGLNRSAFGQPIYPSAGSRDPGHASLHSFTTTPQAFSDFAEAARQAGGPDLNPEIYREILKQMGWAGTTTNALAAYMSGTRADATIADVAGIKGTSLRTATSAGCCTGSRTRCWRR